MKNLAKLIIILLLCSLAITLGITPGISVLVKEKNRDFNEIKTLQADIKSMNLINNLYLSEEQQAKLIPLIREAQGLKQDFQDLISENAAEIEDVLSSMRREIIATKEVSPAVEKKYHELNNLIEDKKESTEKQIQEIVEEVKGILYDNQKTMISEYSPCLVPKQSATNPERIGQAGDSSHMEKILDKVRKIPADKYPQAKEKILARAKEKIDKHFKGQEAKTKLQEVSETLDEARALSNEEFEIKKNEIVSRIKPPTNVAKGKQFDRYIEEFILNPSVADILESQKLSAKETNIIK